MGILKLYGKLVPTGGIQATGSNVLSPAEMNVLDSVTAGTASASKAVVLDTNKDVIGLGKFTHGAFHSTTKGSGIVVNPTYTAVHRVYADDNGAALTPSGAVPDLRVGLDRYLLTADQSAVNIRVWGRMGQVKVYNTLVNGEQIGGVNGRLEIVQAAAGTTTLAGYGISAGVCGIVATSGTVLVNTNHIVAGVAAIADIKGTVTQTGKVAGLYVGKYDTINWSDATTRANWGYGLLIDEDSVSVCPIQVGEFVSSAGTGGGFAVTLTNSAAMRIYAEVTADLTASAMVRSILGRMLASGNFTSTAELFGVVGQLVIKNAKMQHDNAGVLGSLEVQTTAATFSGDIGDTCSAAVLGRVGITITGTVVEADGVLAGVAAMSNITDGYVTVTSGGILAGFYVGKFTSVTKQNWDYGVYVAPNTATRGICVGKYSSTATESLPISGATWLNGFFADDAGASQTASTVWRNLIARTYFSIDQNNAACDYDVIRGHLKAASGVDFGGDTSSRSCIRGYLEMAGATICGAGAFLSGLMGELWGDGDITGTGKVAGVMSRLYTSAGTASGTVAAFMATKQWASTQNWPYGLYIDSATIDIRLQAGPCILSGAGAPGGSAAKGSLYLRTDGSGVGDRAYINIDGSTSWAALTTAS